MDAQSTGARGIVVPVPREQWERHPRYPRQTLLIHSHEGFRKASRWVLERVREGDDLVTAAAVYGSWLRGMRNHEHYEEHKLYPFLSERWGISMTTLCRDHERLHQLDAEVRDGFQHAIVPRGRDAEACRVVLEEAVVAFDAALHRHLDDEENIVIPLLLALEPEEFNRYRHNPVGVLMAELREGRARSSS
jgi:hemerythrin-like domain-containing protein